VVPAADGAGWLIVQPLLTGNVTWDWALAIFIGADHRAALRRAAELFERRLLPPPGMTALPWMNIMNPFQPEALGAGGFFGGGVAAERADYVRAVAFSMTCEMARVFGQVRDKRRIDSVVLGGGASKGAFFRAFLAALFDPIPVYAMREEDLTGPRGSIYAFHPRVASGAADRVPLPAPPVRDRIRAGYAVYEELFHRVFGRERAQPIEFD
jgi:sugar (pentulose or hexulose) kinase